MFHNLIFVPVAAFMLAAGVGVLARSRRGREDLRVRDAFTITK